jgi:hypothetical protein
VETDDGALLGGRRLGYQLVRHLLFAEREQGIDGLAERVEFRQWVLPF